LTKNFSDKENYANEMNSAVRVLANTDMISESTSKGNDTNSQCSERYKDFKNEIRFFFYWSLENFNIVILIWVKKSEKLLTKGGNNISTLKVQFWSFPGIGR
jgi:hypothetical protein